MKHAETTSEQKVTKHSKKSTRGSSDTKARSRRPLTARAVAELCGVELKTVHNWALDGRLAHFRTPGRHLRFQPDAVSAFLRECGYDVRVATRLRVVCVAPRPGARLRKVLSVVECAWVSEIWSALLDVGRSPPDLLIIDGSQRSAFDLAPAIKAVKSRLPVVEVVVIRERAASTDEPRLRYMKLDELQAFLADRT